VRMPLSRTRQKVIHAVKGLVFDKAGFQKMVDVREQHQLEDSMGFRGQWDEHRRFQFEMLKSQGMHPHHKFLELGCGPLTAGIPIIRYLEEGNYVGVDIRDSALDLGWREIGKARLSAKNPRLICSPSFGSDHLGDQKFDFIFSFSVLFHLSDDILDAYFATVSNRVAPGGACLASVNTHLPNDKWLEFPFVRRTIDDYRNAASKHALSTITLGEIKNLGFRNPDPEKHNPLLRFERVI
jgi:SAM-dependent methyltransferase